MLTTFYFDSELFQEDLLIDNNLNHSVLLEHWEKYGCYCYSNESVGAIHLILKNIQHKYRQKWNIAFTEFTKRRTILKMDNISSYSNYDELNADFSQENIKVGFITSTYTELYPTGKKKGKTEVLSINEIYDSEYFINSEDYSQRDILEKEKITDIWNSRFLELSLCTKVITIIDRYLIKNAIDDLNKGKKTSLSNFINLLSKNNKKIAINVYSACDIDGDSTNKADIISVIDNVKNKPFFNSKNITLKVSLCKNKYFSQVAHDRMIRFDNHVVQIGTGFEIFRDKEIVFTTFNIKTHRYTHFKKVYAYLVNNKDTRFIGL
ncbi:hypothetical protein [Proteus terrae]|uniref:hypothetical protein n=1 Tax=Proteus terrae TaxID=1574161 RepID=UPI0034D5226B